MVSSHTDTSGGGTFEVDGVELDSEDSRKARMLYDYEAENDEELTISGGEVYHTILDICIATGTCIDSAYLLHPLF